MDGLVVDTELRWRLLHRLVSQGAAGSAQIDAELRRDPTDAGERRAATCRAAIPEPEAKEAAWQAIISGTLPNATFRAALNGFNDPDQAELLAPYAERYFDVVGEVWHNWSSDMAQCFTSNAYPMTQISEQHRGTHRRLHCADRPACGVAPAARSRAGTASSGPCAARPATARRLNGGLETRPPSAPGPGLADCPATPCATGTQDAIVRSQRQRQRTGPGGRAPDGGGQRGHADHQARRAAGHAGRHDAEVAGGPGQQGGSQRPQREVDGPEGGRDPAEQAVRGYFLAQRHGADPGHAGAAQVESRLARRSAGHPGRAEAGDGQADSRTAPVQQGPNPSLRRSGATVSAPATVPSAATARTRPTTPSPCPRSCFR